MHFRFKSVHMYAVYVCWHIFMLKFRELKSNTQAEIHMISFLFVLSPLV